MAHPTPQYGQTESTALVSDSGASIVSALLNNAPVGHTAAHSPHDTQVDSPMGRLRSKPIWVSAPLPVRPMTSLFWISSQPRMQRSHRMQALWSTAMTGEDTSCPFSEMYGRKRRPSPWPSPRRREGTLRRPYFSPSNSNSQLPFFWCLAQGMG